MHKDLSWKYRKILVPEALNFIPYTLAMAPVKRKVDESKSARPEKKQKASVPSTKPRVLAEEPIFPRGGSSILTPMEQKQIHIQATSDVLFEQSTGQKPAIHEFEDGENGSDQLDQSSGAMQKRKRRKKTQKSQEGKLDDAAKEPDVRIERLSYKVRTREAEKEFR